MRSELTENQILKELDKTVKDLQKLKRILTVATIVYISIGLLAIACDIMNAQAAGTDVPEEIQEAAEEIGAQYSICPEFLEAIAYRESSYDPDASGGGCVGLMQISPQWHAERMKRLGVGDLTDAYSNMLVAADYLSELFEEWEDPGMVLMIYNGDSNAQAYYRGEAELSEYAEDVLTLSEALERKHGK